MFALVVAAHSAHLDLFVTVIIALLLAALVYFVAGLFLPHPVPLIVALLVLLVVFFGGGSFG